MEVESHLFVEENSHPTGHLPCSTSMLVSRNVLNILNEVFRAMSPELPERVISSDHDGHYILLWR